MIVREILKQRQQNAVFIYIERVVIKPKASWNVPKCSLYSRPLKLSVSFVWILCFSEQISTEQAVGLLAIRDLTVFPYIFKRVIVVNFVYRNWLYAH